MSTATFRQAWKRAFTRTPWRTEPQPPQPPSDHMGNEEQEQRIARVEERLGLLEVKVAQELGLGDCDGWD